MTEDMRRRHDDPAGWRAMYERGRIDASGRFVGWTWGELAAVVGIGGLIGLVVGGWVLQGLGVGLWELWR